MARTVAVVGAGWAGLACAVTLVEAGCQVTLFEASRVPGGRARSVPGDDTLGTVDNGQHVLIGPYRETFALMDRIGVDRRQVLRRLPLALHGSDGLRLRVPAWPLGLGGPAGVLGARGLGPGGRRALLRLARAVPAMLTAPDRTVAAWLRECGQPDELTRRLWAPLCVAALNTPADRASARVFARVLHDGLLAAGRDASIEVPSRPLGELLPEPAVAWLQSHGAAVRLRCRVTLLARSGDDDAQRSATGRDAPRPRPRWQVWTSRGEAGPFDAVVVAVAPHQAAALLGTHADAATLAGLQGLGHEAIATVHLRLQGPMPGDVPPLMLLSPDPTAGGPGEWLIDHGAQRASVVVSTWQRDTGPATSAGVPAVSRAAHAGPVRESLAAAIEARLRGLIPGLPKVVASRTLVEKRATFACGPDLHRPGHGTGAAGLWLAGDFTDGPYPATLEGAVRSGLECARRIVAASPQEPD